MLVNIYKYQFQTFIKLLVTFLHLLHNTFNFFQTSFKKLLFIKHIKRKKIIDLYWLLYPVLIFLQSNTLQLLFHKILGLTRQRVSLNKINRAIKLIYIQVIHFMCFINIILTKNQLISLFFNFITKNNQFISIPKNYVYI